MLLYASIRWLTNTTVSAFSKQGDPSLPGQTEQVMLCSEFEFLLGHRIQTVTFTDNDQTKSKTGPPLPPGPW